MWAIMARIHSYRGVPVSEGSRDIPLFYLDENVQGILTERHAVQVARRILDPYSVTRDEDITISAVRMPQQ